MVVNLGITYTEVVAVVRGWILSRQMTKTKGPRPLAEPGTIIFKEWSDTWTFSYTYTHQKKQRIILNGFNLCAYN